MKKTSFFALVFALVLLVSLPLNALADDLSAATVRAKMVALEEDYPEGTPWTNDNYYSWKGGVYSGGYGCAGFAFMLSDAAFGSLKAKKITTIDYDALRPGDILRINGDTHSVIILDKYADHVVIAEGNYNHSVHWYRELTKEKVLESDYYLTRYPNASDPNVAISAENFPDAIFRAYVAEQFDRDGNGSLSESEIKEITGIDVQNKSISSLQGIEVFPALEFLACGYNNLTSLDVSHNPALKVLYCEDNILTSLDVSHNPALEDLDCYSNSLTSLDVSHSPALEYLVCDSNSLTSLDVSHNPALVTLGCDYNGLTSLDVSHNPALIQLYCDSNSLTSLDVSHNPALVDLTCRDNNLTSLDVSHNPALEYLGVGDNMRAVTAEDGRFDLSTLPGFDVTKASDWQGAKVSGNTLTVAASTNVVYTYDCGNGHSEAFSLNVTLTGELPVLPGDADGNGTFELDDIMLMIDYYVGLAGADSISLSNCDLDNDGTVCDLSDIMLAIDYYCQ